MRILISLFILFTSLTYAKTYDLTNRFGLGGGAGPTIPLGETDFNDDAEEDYGYNFHARFQTHKSDGLQFSFSNLDFEDTDLTALVYDITYLWRVNGVDRFTPVLGIGAGVADLSDFEPHDNLKAALKARAGFEYMLSEDLLAAAVVDYHYINKMPDDDDGMPIGEMHVLAPQLNLTLFFGHDKEESDSQDKSQEAAPVVVAAPVVAQIDSDQDGVVDGKDKCPGTPVGKQVNAYGCMEKEKASVQVEVFFPTGAAGVTMNSHDALADLAQFMEEHPDTEVEIQGHTDNVGSSLRNRKLSADRANAVKVYLVEKLGVSPTRITAYGYGDEQPVADNSTREGRAKNRRVMAIISE